MYNSERSRELMQISRRIIGLAYKSLLTDSQPEWLTVANQKLPELPISCSTQLYRFHVI